MSLENCVFCDKSQFIERLIGETADFWIIATLGQITDGGYILLVPKRHVECIGAMKRGEVERLKKWTYTIDRALYKEYGVGAEIYFEHGIVGQSVKHAHLHLIPLSLGISSKIYIDFPNQSQYIMPNQELSGLFLSLYKSKKEPYLLWKDALSSNIKIVWSPPAPMQYLRNVVAEAIGRPERSNWRNMDPELDKKLWSETVNRMKPYFEKKS